MQELTRRFTEALPAGIAHASLRLVDERTEVLAVRDDVLLPPRRHRDVGAMITVSVGTAEDGGVGYAATPDLSPAGLRAAAEAALAWAELARARGVPGLFATPDTPPRGHHASPVGRAWTAVPLTERLDRLQRAAAALRPSAPGSRDRLVSREASVWSVDTDVRLLTTDGGDATSVLHHVSPELEALASDGTSTQRRTLGGLRGASRQGGEEVLDAFAFEAAAVRIADEALELLDAPDCPTERTALLLAPDQMMLQIHESIGHPLELDRILGDERNYAGTSFVTPDMFGSYRYGSELLNVTFAPDVPGELASYAFDDDGAPAGRAWLIRQGLLVRGLGGVRSQRRSGLPGVASTRASTWSRPPIDRMANLNVEPGQQSFDELVASVERGVFMETNLSWSIDDSRNKFQFGCERAREIRDGRLGRVLKNPNYRGVSATFWRNLVGLGDRSTFQVLGTPYCGKGEPNQVIRVGHASPAALFRDVDVFGGGA